MILDSVMIGGDVIGVSKFVENRQEYIISTPLYRAAVIDDTKIADGRGKF
ncbi:hypothetical protein PcaKH35_37780 (plasmid) [Parageobacillus caldoxylosilyticus]|nr:hypothetical protein PcaKH35_37780 [Parageobacillus caldoxylosilyticus]